MIKMVPQCRLVEVLLLSPFCPSHDQARGRQILLHVYEFVWLRPWRQRSPPALEGIVASCQQNGGARQQQQQMTDCLGCLGYLENTLRQHIYFASDDTHILLYTMTRDGAVTVSTTVVFFFLPEVSSIQKISQWLYWKKRPEGQMQIPHVVMTKGFLNKEMEGILVFQQQNSNKEISTGQFKQICQCGVKQAHNTAQGR